MSDRLEDLPVARPELPNPRASESARPRPEQVPALHRLEASRAAIRAAMEAHVRESASPVPDPRGAPRSLAQRLLEQARRFPVVRAVLAIRSLRRG